MAPDRIVRVLGTAWSIFREILRLSVTRLGWYYNTAEEVDRLLEALSEF